MRVVALGSIPKGPGDRVKPDRRDAIRLVRLSAAGQVSFAFVPTVADEAFAKTSRDAGQLRIALSGAIAQLKAHAPAPRTGRR